jgi:ammonia channel protein AmtB
MTLDPEVASAIDMAFVLLCGFLCFLLQAGFGLLEVGSVRIKNAQNIMMKNIMDAVVSALAYWAFGYAFAYGESNNSFIVSIVLCYYRLERVISCQKQFFDLVLRRSRFLLFYRAIHITF